MPRCSNLLGYPVLCRSLYKSARRKADRESCMNEYVGLLTTITKEETGLKDHCLVDFFHHLVMTMNVFTHAYHYSLFNSGTRTGL